MANFTYPVLPFGSTTFTAPLAGTDDVITANVLANFTITGNGGNDVVTTAGGNDTITTGNGNDVINAGAGDNTVTAGNGTNAVTSGLGNDTITTGTGADLVSSGAGNDTITSGSGNDVIDSGGGDDTVSAGTGNDVITPGGGLDVLTGGGGQDTFVYGNLADAQLGVDTIADFSTDSPLAAGEGDRLNLTGLVDGFFATETSLDQLVADGYLDFSAGGGGTVLSYDSNGSAAGGSTGILVSLVGVPFMTEGAAVQSLADNVAV